MGQTLKYTVLKVKPQDLHITEYVWIAYLEILLTLNDFIKVL